MQIIDQFDLFVAGQAGYHTYRIPALAVTMKGTLLAFCEGRKHGTSDAGEIDLLLKRSFDGGSSWEETQIVVTEPEMTCGNPCPVVDPFDGTVWLPFTKNRAADNQDLIQAGKGKRTVWLTRSTDDGATWAEPWEITDAVSDPSWSWYATGPTHGTVLCSGRIIIPCDHVKPVNYDRKDPKHSHVIYSDDHGATWRLGGSAGIDTNECVALELNDGTLYLNCRNYSGNHRRAVVWSHDGGETFSDIVYDDALIEPTCQASLARYDDSTVLFSNPASEKREQMTVKTSRDECRTWDVGLLLHPGPAAYSDLAVLPNGTICCLYERGDARAYEKITLARLSMNG
ncbi:MAG: sialidase family protein [Armatimonadota bacterium]